jgi:malonyl-CoA decarboxylase
MSNWFERFLDTVADTGREIIGLLDASDDRALSDSQLCRQLVAGHGEATNIALAREILQRWQQKNDQDKLQFLTMLAQEFDPNPDEVLQAARVYSVDDYNSLQRLIEVTEPPRQELLRRLNMAPSGTAILVGIRAFLLQHLSQHKELHKLDADFQHLLSSWFNRGFLQLERIDWDTPASILEKLIQYEVVHPMVGWDDLHRRLAEDRRCYAFFHPALPKDPLIFIEIALTSSMSSSITPLIDPGIAEVDPLQADTAIFYSINNALMGLRGVSFGNFLIKQVAAELQKEFPKLRTFATLSPIPMMRRCFVSKDLNIIEDLLHQYVEPLRSLSNKQNLLQAIDYLVGVNVEPDKEGRALLENCLQILVLYYLTNAKRNRRAYDPVMHFHLSNGARLERINLFANMSEYGIKQSWGCMVNYCYESAEIVANHEAYACDGQIRMSKELERQARNLATQAVAG